MALSPDGAALYVANRGDGTVSMVDTATHSVTGTAPVGGSPSSIAVSPGGDVVYVATGSGNTIAVMAELNAQTYGVDNFWRQCRDAC